MILVGEDSVREELLQPELVEGGQLVELAAAPKVQSPPGIRAALPVVRLVPSSATGRIVLDIDQAARLRFDGA